MLTTARKRVIVWLLDRYKQRKQQNVQVDVAHCLSIATELIRKSSYGFLISHGQTEWPSTRLVQPIVDEDFTLWIGTSPALRKVAEVRENAHVTFAIQDDKTQANLILQGMATIEEDLGLRRKYWKGEWRLFFPGGPKSDDYILIRIEVQRMELMSFARNVVPEPFGLRPVKLARVDSSWQVT